MLAVLVDPDKVSDVNLLIQHLTNHTPDFIFVGGSEVEKKRFDEISSALFNVKLCPVIIFPGSHEQINAYAHGILLLSLISGRNPEYLIGQHVKAAKSLTSFPGLVIPTSYLLIDGMNSTSVQQVSETEPISQDNLDLILDTVIAGQFMGHQLHYLEAGSGAKATVSSEIVRRVKDISTQPIIVGGGIRSAEQASKLWEAGADILVVGNGFEEKVVLLEELKKVQLQIQE
ncbi:Geranylgeranylglyceryl phosphate synthase [Parvicella tangerina]|uniref:Geranylgeranylglyceryl phosphate synthase n=2 Tax=Parvicella tangerina TaxID=2829795 RepID=A0A916JKM6_9FLAO|nr:Geranylgeranylglyceryl phosphate synthase [Parvicella tangerina]